MYSSLSKYVESIGLIQRADYKHDYKSKIDPQINHFSGSEISDRNENGIDISGYDGWLNLNEIFFKNISF
ncbi:Uncharacterised protein [uncultured archaeon]|nr:Uncharacterised protein [uncultured archaeon]